MVDQQANAAIKAVEMQAEAGRTVADVGCSLFVPAETEFGFDNILRPCEFRQITEYDVTFELWRRR
ncbi:hypothetical protein [Phenylobacterium sp.]|uniref:hypothetical protein n=1 Tax=Phenylobacterium sp. TaxID=1871053 RepID=UPI00301DE580